MHELEIVNNEAQMFSVGKKPWHGLGKILANPPSVEEGIRMAGLDWTVELRQLYTVDQENWVPEDEVPAQATYRTKDNQFYGVVGPQYTVVQNLDAFKFFDPFIEKGLASLESAGSLFDGRKVWVMAKIHGDNAEILPGDEIEKYMLFSNSHDGTTAVRIGFTPVRVVCANTLAAAHQDGASQLIRVQHTSKVNENIELLRETMDTVNQQFEASAQQYRTLARKGVNTADLQNYVRQVFKLDQPLTDEERENGKGVAMSKIVDTVELLFQGGRGVEIPGVRGTYWGAYNAVTEYLQYFRGRTDENRFNSLWFEDGRSLNKRALSLALAA